jgi:hypothetical protein
MIIFDQLKKNDPHLRAITWSVLIGMVVLLAGLWWVQIISYRHYSENQKAQSFRTVRVPAVRGKILDRNARYFESAIRDAHAQGLISAPDAKAKARMLVAFFQGCLAQARIENDIKPLRGLAAGALELLGAQPELSAK